MIATQTSTRPEAVVPPASLATDFDEWMAGWAFTWSGTRHTGKPLPKQATLPGNAWKSFKQEPRLSPTLECPTSPRQQFLHQVSPSKLGHSGSSSSFGSPYAKNSSGTSFGSLFAAPAEKSDPLFVTEFFEVRRSLKGGYGAFATRDIEVGTVIMTEKPLLRANLSTFFHEHEKLSTEQKADYQSLYACPGLSEDRRFSIFMTNRFELLGSCGIFIKSSRFNHACHPHRSCSYRWNEELGCLVTTAINPIKKGEEITIRYNPNPSTLYGNYGFDCDCPSCVEPKVIATQDS
ncbi:hypothetical protein EG329_008145 [Mollisiaceae sp. DMI_Dod_QoI]|nr:hypothetical protein EG329_008145 [Helotiales sp. DMI_Dod_QoI]